MTFIDYLPITFVCSFPPLLPPLSLLPPFSFLSSPPPLACAVCSPSVFCLLKQINVMSAQVRKRVCLFGTSADPPTGHGGHLGIVKHLVSMKQFDEVRVLPVYRHMFQVSLMTSCCGYNIHATAQLLTSLLHRIREGSKLHFRRGLKCASYYFRMSQML